MKIAVASLSSDFGLSEQEAIRYFTLFSKIQPTVMFIKRKSQIETQLKLPPYKKYKSKIEALNYQSDWNPFYIISLRQKLIKLKINVVILFSSVDAKSFIMASRGLNIKLILRQDQLLKERSKNWFDKVVMSKIDAVVPTSQYLAANLQSDLSNLESHLKTEMIYDCIELDELSIQESFEEKNKFIRKNRQLLEVLNIGDIRQEGGQFEALIAVKNLKDGGFNFKLTFVGNILDGAYYQKMLHYLKEHDLCSHIHFAGHHQDVKHFYQNAHLLLCLVQSDAHNNLYIDALSHGLPILAFESSVFLELQLLGFKVHLATDQKALNAKLESMAINIKKLLRLAMDGNPNLIQQYFSAEIMLKNWLELIRSIDDNTNLKCG